MIGRTAAVRRVVPETIQTSGMDCGPAALHSLLHGYGIEASYGRLREACQTDVDGTSIDALEGVARALGLDVAQLMLPADHVALASATALPAIAVARLPSGMPHFVVAWRRHGRLVQVMDPATGRRISSSAQLTQTLYIHEQAVPYAAWEGFAASPAFQDALLERLAALGLRRRAAHALVACASEAGGRAMAALDAKARALAAESGPRRGRGAALARAVEDPDAALATLAPELWFARPLTPGPDPDAVMLRGAVLVRARGHADEPPDLETLSPDLATALTEPAPRPAARLLEAARAAGRVAFAPLAAAIVLMAGGVVAEAALLQGSLDALDVRGTLLAVAAIALALAAVETWTAAAGLGIGRRLEVGLRRALDAAVPRLPDRYLRSRPPSDMAERAHALHELRRLPLLATQLLAALLETLFVAVALCVLDPAGAPFVVLATLGALGVALLVQLPLRERELRAREHASALSQTTLDAVLGVLAIRAHGAEPALAGEHDTRLRGWVGAARAAVHARGAATLMQTACGIGLAIPLVLAGLDRLDTPAERLLLVLWAVSIPVAAERVGQLALQWPQLRTLAVRLAEPLDAAPTNEDDAPRWAGPRKAVPVAERESPHSAGPLDTAPAPGVRAAGRDRGVALAFEAVGARATGQDVLAPTTLRVDAGEHVALVGLSGAGKSTLLALALGLADPSEGRVHADGLDLAGDGARALWPAVAWVDPQVRVWNRDLAHNIAPLADTERVRELVTAAELEGVAARVGGEALGADGGLLSGGEAQRVRLARALAREGVRLAVLDEPLRGLDRDQRHRLLAVARSRWRDATLLCATHDVVEALGFDRVLVVDGGRIVADGPPHDLLAQQDSPLRAMLDAERELRRELDADGGWRRLRVADGGLHEHARIGDEPPGLAPARTSATGKPSRAGERQALTAGGPSGAVAGGHRTGSAVRHPGRALTVFAGATIARYAAFAAAWSVIGAAIFDGRTDQLATWALLLAATVPLAALAVAAEGRAAISLGARLRERTLRGALALDPGWVRREGPGRVLGRSMEVDAVARLAAGGGLAALTAMIELAVGATALLASGAGRIAALALGVVLAVAALVARASVRRRREWTGARLAQTDELLEAIAGQRTRLIQGDAEAARRRTQLDGYARLGAAADRPLAALAGALPRVALAAMLASIALAADVSDPSDVALALGGALLAAQALRRIAAAVQTLTSASLARQALAPILSAQAPSPATPPRAAGDGTLSVRALSVQRGGRQILRDVDLDLRPGDAAILSGASGAGKSTLAAALAGLLNSSGSVSLDGRGPTDAGWRTRVGLVPQHGDNHVLLAPVAFNLLMGRTWPPSRDDLDEAQAVCEALGLGPLLERMPAGLGQVIGETGWRLSQGERARLCLARALLADHDVLILDEPLGALDPHTARTILDVVRRHARTLVVISQE